MHEIKFPFLEHIGGKLIRYDRGMAEVELSVEAYHLQHMGFVHGGVISTLMDNTGWYAAVSNLAEGHTSVTMEIKINYLKPVVGKSLRAIGNVVRQGRSTSFVKIELYDGENLVAFATGTYAVIEDKS
ncbi:MAG: PaaI family thioesterase [Sulfuricurvum sp.]|uniref:PaaI family thioesterase n=1 Tax=Sulfuricurvum sp. TaxID=2025608 RepID=UPI00261A41C6|nr:PaaI family thioesterase [Sulfuricurvum sp.]MDD2837877.1 PaaI family thioesterase [Sulfuricurvum sp.]MDD3598312.1 PaaI family thioesterase [Sulfuricurvum sp.]MDD4883660.1 PaaI family thioesterase [Sulfuricurvum sp.]